MVAFHTIIGKNKPRIYLAYDSRRKSNPNEEPFHIALFAVPKDPSSDGTCRRYHVMNTLEPTETGPPRQIWRFRSEDTDTNAPPLAGLLFLGKLSRGKNLKELEHTLVRVAINNDDPKWRCRHWALDAIQALFREQIIKPLAQSPNDLWKTGKEYTLAHMSAANKEGLPVCDMHGNTYVLQ
ncbi:hypothetical protein OF83DRAFT_1108166 [Amylostereum chailletii]|nr:hypothetical protein OF83DRAFT_1108166 [Amylostereum chailletii]